MARLSPADNSCRLRFDLAEAVRTVKAMAASTQNEKNLAAWLQDRLTSPP